MSEERKRWKRGDIGPDGRVFWEYQKRYNRGEYWLSNDKYKQRADNQKAHVKAYAQTDKRKAYEETYRQTDEYRAYQKAYHQTDEYKAHKKAKDQARHKKKKATQCARNYMAALLLAQQLSEALKNKQPDENENTK